VIVSVKYPNRFGGAMVSASMSRRRASSLATSSSALTMASRNSPLAVARNPASAAIANCRWSSVCLRRPGQLIAHLRAFAGEEPRKSLRARVCSFVDETGPILVTPSAKRIEPAHFDPRPSISPKCRGRRARAA